MKEIRYWLGGRIRALRSEKGLSQEELGEKSGLHEKYVGAVERGEKNCSVATIEKIAKGLEVGISDLFLLQKSKSEITALKESVISEIKESRPEVVKLVSDLLKQVKVTKTTRKPAKKPKEV
ncbi:MAG: HTH-type transcriptional regulator SinR [Syntrophorhabdus sp. PtaU1.Bin153]|nr:MAG: HTH-type transcriptional regulator SinR [Syntrophorhabdus sp. PtaU1.Bin153]